MSDVKDKAVRTRKPANAARAQALVTIVITADHVYLPIDDAGNIGTPWTASDISTSRVSRRTRLTVPVDLARFLYDRDQAEIVIPAPAKATEDTVLRSSDPVRRSLGEAEGAK